MHNKMRKVLQKLLLTNYILYMCVIITAYIFFQNVEFYQGCSTS